MKVVLGVLLVGLAFLVLSLLTFWLAVRPPRLRATLSPGDVGLVVEDLVVRTEDGLALAGWLAARPGAPAVILLHGYPADKTDLLPLAAALHKYFCVVLVDLRYFGGSEGRATTLGYRERADLQRVVDELHRRQLGPIGVFGFSLGGAVGLMTAAEDARIRAVVAYAPFADLEVLARDLYRHLWVLREPFVGLMRLWARVFLGVDVMRPSPAERATRLAIPVLLIHSREDEQISFRHAERLRQALAGNPAAEFLVLDRGRHGELDLDAERRIIDFLRRSLGGAGAKVPVPAASVAPARAGAILWS